jgi:hypothetical protein
MAIYVKEKRVEKQVHKSGKHLKSGRGIKDLKKELWRRVQWMCW